MVNAVTQCSQAFICLLFKASQRHFNQQKSQIIYLYDDEIQILKQNFRH